jgi:Zn-dependent peptidase ImmA (M78 family)
MARGTPALIKPSLLIWARESTGLKPEQAAKKAQVELEVLRQWERGEEQPSIPQLRKLGEVYKRPLAVFFLPEPPKGFDPQREFRRLPGTPSGIKTPGLLLALRNALFRREAARELHERLSEPLANLRAAAHPDQDPETVGLRIRELLRVSWEDQLGWPSAYSGLNAWRDRIERHGVLVFQTGGVRLSEMRGTSVLHGPLPVILLNNSDAPHGRIFTLLHEFAHLLLANGGHRTSPMEGERVPEEQVLERVSNRFAATALMPKAEFLSLIADDPEVLQGSDTALRRVANRIKVSPEAILRRLVSLHRVSPSVYKTKRKSWQEHPWSAPQQGEGGPSIEVKVVSAVGRPFVSLVLEGYQRNAISSADVSDYLGVQLKHLDKIAAEVAAKPGKWVSSI